MFGIGGVFLFGVFVKFIEDCFLNFRLFLGVGIGGFGVGVIFCVVVCFFLNVLYILFIDNDFWVVGCCEFFFCFSIESGIYFFFLVGFIV